MNTTPHILICDDDPVVHESLGLYLQPDGYTFCSAFDGEAALSMIESEAPDLIVLDQMMPKMSGSDVCREVRKTHSTPIIMLTAKGEEIDRILGLELGADDYIVKPFSPREVVARIKAVLRRIGERKEEQTGVLRYGTLEINLPHYQVSVEGEAIACTPKEVEILHLLASHPSQVFSREQILNQIWGYDFYGDTRTVDTHIKRIRAKLLCDDAPWGLKTIYGVGYKFEASNT